MKTSSSAIVAIALVCGGWSAAHAQAQSEVTLLAVGPMRAPTQKIIDRQLRLSRREK